MKLYIQDRIRELSLKGYGYQRIANVLDISPNTVKSHLRRHPAVRGNSVCRHCGKPLNHIPGRREKKYCSDKCRMAFWNSHQELVNKQAYYTLTCKHGGKEFVAYGNRNRKYCNRSCYAEARRKAG